MTDTAASEVTIRGPQFTDEELLGIDSFDKAIALASEVLGAEEIVSADEELGNGFAILPTDQKHRLCGVPLFFLTWSFHEGEQGEFVSIMVVARSQQGTEKWVVNDGSTGICKQLRQYTEKTNKKGGLLVKHGLVRSDYEYEAPDGSKKPATTYYLDTSA